MGVMSNIERLHTMWLIGMEAPEAQRALPTYISIASLCELFARWDRAQQSGMYYLISSSELYRVMRNIQRGIA